MSLISRVHIKDYPSGPGLIRLIFERKLKENLQNLRDRHLSLIPVCLDKSSHFLNCFLLEPPTYSKGLSTGFFGQMLTRMH